MGLFDDRRPKIKQGPEYWIDRIRGEIGFRSPSGIDFTGKWIYDTRSKQKRLQLTDYLEQNLTKTRDLGIASTTHPIDFFFDGNDCDKFAEKFWNACDEKGEWEVLHPVNGFQSYQLVSVSQENDYVRSGGAVKFSTDWILPQDFNPAESGRELASMADSYRSKVDQDSALSFAEKLQLGSDALRKGAQNASLKVDGFANKTLGPLAAINDFAYESFLSASEAMKNFELSTVYQAMALAGQLQNLIGIAVKSTSDTGKRVRAYSDMLTRTVGSGFSTIGGKTSVLIRPNYTGINTARIIELASISCISALCEVATTSKIETVSGGIELLENIVTNLDLLAAQLDSIQSEVSTDLTTDKSFIALQTTRKSIDDMVSATIRYILFAITKAKVRKIKVIENQISTIVFFLKTYKTPVGFEDFCDRNNLSDYEIFILPSGREIQV